MGFPDRPRRARLDIEKLEDRTTPASLDAALEVALPELAATGEVVGDRINVVMTAETNNASDAAALAGSSFAQSVMPLGFGIYSVTLTPGTDLTEAIEFYGQFEGVQSASPDTIVQVQRVPNDPRYSSLYGMNRISAPAAWDITTGTPGFVVAVIDSGVDYNHPDLAANMWRNPGEIAGDGLDNDGNGFIDDIFGADFANNDGNPMDDNNHGTHVAGTIGAVGNNAVGVAGVNWNVKIMALKFLSASGSGATSNAVRALDYAVAKGAKVSNNSWGGGGASTALEAAIGRARTAGHIFVAAAGNSGLNIDTTPSYPASYAANYNNIVNVAATDSNDNLAGFSNFGATRVQLAAPGVGILSTTPNNTYSSFNGTSMAAPHVAGAIALYWGANPTLSYQQVISKLTSSVDPVASLNGRVSTGGRLNVAKMFAGTTSPPVFVSGPKVTAATFSGTTAGQFNRVTVTFDKAVAAASFTAADVTSFVGPNGAISTTFTVAPVSGTTNQFTISFAAQTAAGSYSLTFGPNITDTAGNAMNQNNNTTNGEAGDRFTAGGALTQNVTRTYSTGTIAVNINDLSTAVSTLNVADNIRVSDLNVAVTLTHTWDSDLVITLTSPTVNGVAGRTVTLFNRRGGSGDNLTNTRFDDEAGTAIANGAAPFNGTYRPDGLLSAFDGLSTKGVWTLRVQDVARGDVGRLTNWSITTAGTLGVGGLSMMSFGFPDESAPDVGDDALPLADEIAVDVSTSFAEPVVAEPAPVASAGANPLLFLLGDDGERAAEPPAAPGDFADREDRPSLDAVAGAPDVEEDAAYAMLYFAPAATEATEDVFEAFAVD